MKKSFENFFHENWKFKKENYFLFFTKVVIKDMQ